ncbi:MAG: hypothetical protein ABSG68_20125, partial [Thermoguttaceae bacterium]
MTSKSWCGGGLYPVVFGLWAALFAAAVGPVQAAPQDAQIQARIDAGEFAPAIAMARQAGDPRQQDAWLAQIAEAQTRAGAANAALASAAQIGDDRARAQALARTAATPIGAPGGGNEADFQPLMDLITSTIQPTTWDTVGGPGSLAEFPTGVWVDPQGVLQPLMKEESGRDLAALRAGSRPKQGQWRDDAEQAASPRHSAPLRRISLPRLEKQIQLLLASGRQPTEEMQVLAG